MAWRSAFVFRGSGFVGGDCYPGHSFHCAVRRYQPQSFRPTWRTTSAISFLLILPAEFLSKRQNRPSGSTDFWPYGTNRRTTKKLSVLVVI